MRIGKVTDSVLRRSVLKIANNNKAQNNETKGAAASPDCALSVDKEKGTVAGAVSTFTAPATKGGYYAVHNAANNLFTCGVKPEMIILNVMLPPEKEESDLKEIMRDCRKAADELKVSIEGGHTEVTDALTRPLISAVAVGRAVEQKEPVRKIIAGDAVVMTGWAAIEGTAILATECEKKLKERFPAPLIAEAASFDRFISVRKASEIAIADGAYAIHDISGGGVFAALWELSVMADCGLDVDLKAIPIRQETVEITNYLGLNPYQMLSGGALLMITDNECVLCEKLQDNGIPATVIGMVTGNNDKILRNEDEVRYLDKPAADEILRMNRQ